METVVERPAERLPGSPDPSLQDTELVHELSRRLDLLCHYAECIARQEGNADVQQTWRDLEAQELENIRKLKDRMADRIERGEFLEDL